MGNAGWKLLAGISWIVYVGYLLLSDFPPGESVLHVQPATIQTALDLSLNFWFVTPIVFPKLAPVLNPALEGLFNLVVAWGLLFWGFALDGRRQRVPILPVLIGIAFITNVFYLPWLALRQPNRDPIEPPLNRLEKFVETRYFSLGLGAVFLASVAWSLWGRPEFGDWTVRMQSLWELLTSNRLTYSFAVDLLVFWLFQAWLVPDDMARRNYTSSTMLWIARLVPYFGLILYFLNRPATGVTASSPEI